MARSIHAYLRKLAKRDYRPDTWRREDDVVDLLTQFGDIFRQLMVEFGRWIPYSMPAVDAVHDALLDGTIQPDDVPEVIRNVYMWAFERNLPHVRRYMVHMAITRRLLQQAT